MRPRLTGMVHNGNPRNILKKRFSLRKPALKKKLECKGGALSGHTLYLSTAGTMPFSLNGRRGFYNSDMNWVEL